jgi:hypothetical protein
VEEREEDASRLTAAPGEHNVTFHHPAGSVSGVLELEAEHPPRGTAWDLPLPEDGALHDADGTYRGHGFPSIEHLPVLTATLRSNLPVRLEQVTLSHWTPGHAHVDAAVAIVGWAASGTDPSFDRLRVQATGFAQFFGTRPLSRVTAPGLFDGRSLDEVTVGFEAEPDLEWVEEEIKTSARWSTSIGGIGDAFHFEIKSSPWIEIGLAEPSPWDPWLHQWLQPLVDLVSLATGDGQYPTVVEVSRKGDGDDPIDGRLTASVFGSGVTQAPFSVRFAHHRPALFTLARLPYSLNELVHRWRALRERITGFVDAYLPIVRGVRQTPAAELLLLATAAEAVHVARRGEGPTTADEHRARRQEVLNRLSNGVTKDDLAFLKRHVSRRDAYSLEQRLAELVADCPIELHESLDLNGLARRVAELRNDLAYGRGVPRESLAPAAKALRAVLNVQLLLELELPPDGVVEHERWRD